MSGLDLLDLDDDAPRGPFGGLVVAVVSNVGDPDKHGRVKVMFPSISGDIESDWVRVLAAGGGGSDAGARGLLIPYAVGDEVVVGFLGGQFELPVVVGALWSQKQPAPAEPDDRVSQVVLRSASGHTLRLDDKKDAEKIELVAAEEKDSLTIDAANGKITVAADKELEIKVGADITLVLKDGEVTITCKKFVVQQATEVSIAGQQITVEADKSLELSGGSGINLNNGALEVSS